MRSALTRRKKSRNRAFHLECLEGRELLSVAGHRIVIAGHVVPQAPPLITIMHGHVVGMPAQAGTYVRVQTPPTFSFSGHGTASPVGYVNFGGQHFQTPTNVAG